MQSEFRAVKQMFRALYVFSPALSPRMCARVFDPVSYRKKPWLPAAIHIVLSGARMIWGMFPAMRLPSSARWRNRQARSVSGS